MEMLQHSLEDSFLNISVFVLLSLVVRSILNHGSVAPAKNSRLSPLPPECAGFNYGVGETIDIPVDGSGDLKKRERELQAKEAELRKCEEIHIGFCIFAAVAPPIMFKGKSLIGILAAIDIRSDHALVRQVYMYVPGSGKAAKMKRKGA
ncbi:hypothetical protein RchiOBHm_Chr5g0007411 [Rosa chinensis]|uniref:Uncharacterized protein n=1 Tax=Rosa chinensis TaxID=74649 RepID=A0A2P6Q3T9_ROSCH|nr:hypothetical protein RchiOBHm_Chr5g0007411 [Rosa chinensis]